MLAKLRPFFKKLGPGIITGAADDDPSGIATYTQAGAGFGFSMLWAALFTAPLMIAVQETCARIGIVTRCGLICNLQRRYSRTLVWAVVALLVIANTINIGADLGMMAAAMRLLVPLPIWFWLVLFAGLTILLEVFVTYKVYARYLKWLTLSLLSYVLVAFAVHVDWLHAFKATIWPVFSFNRDYLLIFVAFLGTTISPYLFFWQANEEVEEGLSEPGSSQPSRIIQRIKNMRVDTYIGMLYSNAIAWFIVLTAATVLWSNGLRDIQSADQAAAVLAPLAGRFAAALFTLGIVGIGLLAIPVLAGSAAYAVSEALCLPEGLAKKWCDARMFYGIIAGVIVVGLLFNIFGINPVKALIYAAVINAIVAVPLLFIIQRLANDRKLMGKHVSDRGTNIIFWIAFAVMGLAALALLLIR